MAIVSANGAAVAQGNLFINGAFEVDQRNNGASKTYTVASGGGQAIAYAVDRWGFSYLASADLVAQRITGSNTGTPYSFKITGATGNTGANFSQRIESANIAHLVGQTITFTGYIYVTGGVSNIIPFYATTSSKDNWAATSSYSTFTAFVTPNGLTKVTFSFVVPPSASNGLEFGLYFNGGLGAGKTVEFANFQIEASFIATPFKRNSSNIQQELAACQRYFYRVAPTTGTGGYHPLAAGYVNTTGLAYLMTTFPTAMRVPPSFNSSAANTFGLYMSAGYRAVTSLAPDQPNTTMATFGVYNSSNQFTAGNGCILQGYASANAWIEWSAEL